LSKRPDATLLMFSKGPNDSVRDFCDRPRNSVETPSGRQLKKPNNRAGRKRRNWPQREKHNGTVCRTGAGTDWMNRLTKCWQNSGNKDIY